MLCNQTSIDTRSRERRLRAGLEKHGFYLRKTPSQHWTREHFRPGYMVLKNNFVNVGAANREYDATLEECERFLETPSRIQRGRDTLPAGLPVLHS